jgi:hypothetical protein
MQQQAVVYDHIRDPGVVESEILDPGVFRFDPSEPRRMMGSSLFPFPRDRTLLPTPQPRILPIWPRVRL